MLARGIISPPPTTEPADPFAPDPTMWPEAPAWLFPSVMVLVGLVVAGIIVMLVLWRRSVVLERRERAQRPPTEWVDLSKLDKKGRWEDDGPALDAPDEGRSAE